MIPHTFHRIWLGSKPIPEEAERYWQAFQELHPGWDFRTWTDADDYSWIRNGVAFERSETWTSRSDVLRFEILARFGGIYVDVDVEPLRSFAPLTVQGAFAGWEDTKSLCGAVIGAEPDHPAVLALIDALPGWIEGRRGAPPHEWAGPRFLTAQWSGRRDVVLESSRSFYPIHWTEKRRQVRYPGSYSVHHWSKSWGLVNEPSLSILMAWTDKGDEHRGRVKAWVERFWRSHLPGAQFLIGSDGGREPFNRSACFNDAARRAHGDVFLCIDADLVFDPQVAVDAARLVASTRSWVVPWHTNFRLNQGATDALLGLDPETYVVPQRPGAKDVEGREPGIGLQFAGGAEIIPRAAWELVGGMPESFEGWGSEDIGFSLALDTLWGPHLVPPTHMFHLWHPRPQRDTMNAALELEYWAACGDPEAMRRLIGTTGEAPDLPEASVPSGWRSSRMLKRRPGLVPRQRERYLRRLLVPA